MAALQTSRPPRPAVPFTYFDQIPPCLRDLPQWVLWRYHWSGDKWTKVPFYEERIGRVCLYEKASSTAPETWTDFDLAAMTVAAFEDSRRVGLGFVFTADDAYVGIDLDKCRDKQTGEIAEWAMAWIKRLNSYTDISPSDTGVKIIIRGKKPGPRSKNDKLGVEVYETGRFFTITGRRLPDTPADVNDRQEALDELYRWAFPESEASPASSGTPRGSDGTGGPVAGCPLPGLSLSDAEIVERAHRSRNGHAFWRLWNGDHSGYESKSSADFALASTLAVWCGPDAGRIESLMRQSGLRRAKWERKDYLPRTVANAVRGCSRFYDPRGELENYQMEETFNRIEILEAAEREQVAATGPSTDGGPVLTSTERLRQLVEAACQAEPQAAAQAIRDCKYSRYFHACEDVRWISLEHRQDGSPAVACVRCEKRTCRHCREYLDERELINARCRFNLAELAGQQIHELNVTEAGWSALARRIRRAGGEYIRCREECPSHPGEVVWRVWTNVAVPHSFITSASDCVGNLKLLLAEYGDRLGRPVSTSHGWCLPRIEDETRQYRRRGKAASHLTPNAIDQIAAACGATAQFSTPQRKGKLIRFAKLVKRDGWDDRSHDQAFTSLAVGEPTYLADIEDEFPPQRPDLPQEEEVPKSAFN